MVVTRIILRTSAEDSGSCSGGPAGAIGSSSASWTPSFGSFLRGSLSSAKATLTGLAPPLLAAPLPAAAAPLLTALASSAAGIKGPAGFLLVPAIVAVNLVPGSGLLAPVAWSKDP